MIDVVVPTYDGWEILRSCLDHLREQTAQHRVIVVDDASSDGTAERVETEYPEVELVALPENRGFSRAVNAGIAAGDGEIVVLLNNDVECRPEFVERITAPLAADPALGSVAALLLQRDGRTVDNLGLEIDYTLAGFPRHWGEPAAAGALGGTDGLLGPVGGAGAYRREALEAVGALDEAIFGYGEDLDLALRLRAAGWGCAAAPGRGRRPPGLGDVRRPLLAPGLPPRLEPRLPAAQVRDRPAPEGARAGGVQRGGLGGLAARAHPRRRRAARPGRGLARWKAPARGPGRCGQFPDRPDRDAAQAKGVSPWLARARR